MLKSYGTRGDFPEFLKLQRLPFPGGAGAFPDRGIPWKGRQRIPSFFKDRCIFSGCHEQSAGCEEISLTFAPEAGSQRLRDVINKGLTEEEILQGAADAFKGGWNRVKLYFMLGLPTETVEDMEGIALLSEKIAEEYYEIPKDQRNGKVRWWPAHPSLCRSPLRLSSGPGCPPRRNSWIRHGWSTAK